MKLRLVTKCEEGIYRVHSANCQDVKRDLRNGFEDEGKFVNVDDVVVFLFEDQIVEDSEFTGKTIGDTIVDYQDELVVMPCAELNLY